MIDGVILTDCKTLEEYCEKKLAEYKEKGWSTIGCTIEFYNEAGVYTLEEAKKWELYGTYSDIHKDAYGFRPRFNFKEYTVNELEEMLDDVVITAKRVRQEEEFVERKNWKEYRKQITEHAKYFGISVADAIIEDIRKSDVAYADGRADLGYYLYKKELPFKKDKIIAKVLGQKIEKTFGDRIIYIGE